MAADKMDILHSSLLDNDDERVVEFMGEVDGEEYQFAVQYDVLEALSTVAPEGDAVAIFKQHAEEIADLGVVALARDPDQEIVVISENDLE